MGLTESQRKVLKQMQTGSRLVLLDRGGVGCLKLFKDGHSTKLNAKVLEGLLLKEKVVEKQSDKDYKEYILWEKSNIS